jgi:hypothetical protein
MVNGCGGCCRRVEVCGIMCFMKNVERRGGYVLVEEGVQCGDNTCITSKWGWFVR